MFKWLTARRERREQFRRALMERVRAANFAPTVTVDDVLRIIRRDFPNEICNEILAELSAYGPAQRHFELHRVHAAILKLSKGERGRIGQFLHSDQDFRDVITLAEIPGIAKTMLSLQEFVERPIDEIEGITQRDRDQYLKWFNGKEASWLTPSRDVQNNAVNRSGEIGQIHHGQSSPPGYGRRSSDN